jgi:hypothetical protein
MTIFTAGFFPLSFHAEFVNGRTFLWIIKLTKEKKTSKINKFYEFQENGDIHV